MYAYIHDFSWYGSEYRQHDNFVRNTKRGNSINN